MNDDMQTRDHLLLAALRCFSAQGIKKTSMDDVAHEAGLTRVTVYRYFGDKRTLVRAAFLHAQTVFQQADTDLAADPQMDIEVVLERIDRSLSAFPPGDVAARLDELRRLYPDIYEEEKAVRLKVVGGLFDRLFARSAAQGLLRPGLDRTFVEVIFWEAVKDIFENPALNGLGLSNVEMFRQFIDILRHGVLKN